MFFLSLGFGFGLRVWTNFPQERIFPRESVWGLGGGGGG